MREALDGEAFDRLMQDFANGGRWDLVLRLSRDRLASVLGCPYGHRWAAWGALETGELDAAAWHVAQLEALAPDVASTFRVLAELHYAHSRWDEARECVEQAIIRWPENAHYYLMLSRIHEYQDDRPAAVAAAEQALRLDPQDVAARFAVNLYKYDGILKVHQIEGQIAELLSIVSDDPHNATILAEIGELYLLRLNQPAAAFSFLEQALSNCPRDERIERLYHLARYRLAYLHAPPLDFTFQNATPSAVTASAMTGHFVPTAPPWSTVSITTGVSANFDPSWIDTLSMDIDADALGD